MNHLFKIIFEDNTEFLGGTLSDSKWDQIPTDKRIQTLCYYLPEKTIKLQGYDRYYHQVVRHYFLNSERRGETQIGNSYLFAQHKNKVYVKKMNFQTSEIEEFELDINDKKITQMNPVYWRG